MRLCGLNIPYEHQNFEKTAANRIHRLSEMLVTPETALGFDNLDIAGALRSLFQDAQGILRAVEQNQPVDLSGRVIEEAVVRSELVILSEDLTRMTTAVQGFLNSDAGKARWSKDVVYLNQEEISILKSITELADLSKTMKKAAERVSAK